MSSRLSSGGTSLLCVALIFQLALLTAQEPVPLVRASSRLVLLDVVVTDKAGHPIRGLTRDDFTILENGVIQKITSFEAASTLNTTDKEGGPRNIILLDQLNIKFSDLAYARDRIVMYLERNPAEKQPTALMTVGPYGLAMVENFTRDSKELQNKLAHLHSYNANPKGDRDEYLSQQYAEKALESLTQIARATVGSPYSLNVIWFTSGFPGALQASSQSDEKIEAGLRNVANLLIRSRMRLYTIDPAGVMPINLPAPVSAKASKAATAVAPESAASQVLGSGHTEQFQADVLLSRMTRMMGGLSYYGRNDVEQALSQAILDGSSAYAISYAPSDSNFNSGYRSIEVRTKVEGSAARTRKGYYAVPDEQPPSPELSKARLEAALDSPLGYAGVEVTCPATFDAASSRITGKLTMTPRAVSAGTDEKDQIIRIASFSEHHKLLNEWSWRTAWKSPWTNRVVTASFDRVLSPKATTVRFLVSDPAAERIGTCDYRIQ